ncbi:restriction endonuclease subunit S [Phascolarctobacterium succinatutens]|uniref:restriction endonuclease subunit S n=1 Tax=Phascolarctobacterium succinatutens TaxID=626940 RepID=UPI00307790AB
MREMKDSGIEWIGEIPKDWERGCIKNILEVLTDYTANGSFADLAKNVHYLDNDGFARLVRLTDLRLDLSNDDGVYVGEKTYNYLAKSSLFGGEILVANVGAYAGLFCEMPPKEGRFTLGPNMFLLRTNKRMIQHYLFYLGQAKFVKEQLAQKAISSAQPKLNKTDLKTVFIAIPSIAEQQQIADYLDTKCSEIDATAEDIQKEISLLEEYKKSVITEAVTKGLNPDAEMKDSGIEWVGKVPVTWKIMPNKYIMTKKKVIKEVYDDENIISLSMNGVIVRDLEAGGKMPKTFDGYQIVYPGNLLMCLFDYDVTPRCIGLIKDYGVTSPAYSQFVMNNDNYSGYYYYYYLMIDHAKTLLHLAKNLRHSFTEEQLGAILAPVPTVEEQYQIVNYLDTKCSEIDTLIADKKRQLDTLADYKKSLIYEYVTGKKEVI